MLKAVDIFTSATCLPPSKAELDNFKVSFPDRTPISSTFSCALEADKSRCLEGGGICQMERDGYYITNICFVILGALLFWGFIRERALSLQNLPLRAWRVGNSGGYQRVSTG
jgi:MFS transporter, PAT family, solute carrier family 33 (acetyl-CoA transportor), member 1